jgi:hypothetical protein
MGRTLIVVNQNCRHTPGIMEKFVSEIDAQLPALSETQPAYLFADVETSLLYLR